MRHSISRHSRVSRHPANKAIIFFFFFWCSLMTGGHTCKVARFPSLAWGVGVRTLLVQEQQGKCFMHAPAHTGQCGTGSGRLTCWSRLVCSGSLPTKTPGCLHQSRWRSSLFVEHLAHVPCTILVFKAFFSKRYSFVIRQSSRIRLFIFLYHLLYIARSGGSWSLFWILLSHLRTQMRCADSDISILYTLGARCPGNQWEHLGYIAGSGSLCLHCNHQSHLENI